MSLLLNWRVWLALALVAFLSFTHLTAYRQGKANDRAQWLASVAAANEDARKLQERRQDRADEAQKLAAGRDAAIRADADRARLAADGMRSTLDATEQTAKESAEASARVVSAYRAVFESCTAEYRAMGEAAAGHASDSMMYDQSWPM